MNVLTHAFKDGTTALLQRKGNQSVIQIIDTATGKILKTRCKSVSKTTVPINSTVSTRTTIGFIPQQLKSHNNARTRLQVGFMPEGQKPARYKTDLKRNHYYTVTKTDFDADMNIVNINNIQRIYDSHGRLIKTVKAGTNSQNTNLTTKQREILSQAKDKHTRAQESYESTLSQVNDEISSFKAGADSLIEDKKVIEELILENEERKLACLECLSINNVYRDFWNKEVRPKVLESAYPQFSKYPGDIADKEALNELEKAFNIEKQLNNLLGKFQTQIASRIKEINSFTKQYNSLLDRLKHIKSHQTKAEAETRKQLCDIQKEIMLSFKKQST